MADCFYYDSARPLESHLGDRESGPFHPQLDFVPLSSSLRPTPFVSPAVPGLLALYARLIQSYFAEAITYRDDDVEVLELWENRYAHICTDAGLSNSSVPLSQSPGPSQATRSSLPPFGCGSL